MKRLLPLLPALAFLLLLPGCGEDSPLVGTWVPDAEAMRLTWTTDKDAILMEAQDTLETDSAAYRLLERQLQQGDLLVEDFAAMGMEVTFGTGGTFTHRRGKKKRLEGGGTFEFGRGRVICKPGEGDGFIMGRAPVDFRFVENRLRQVLPKPSDPTASAPKLILKPKL